ncbi:MAG: hypothetical protein AB4352_03720 [Hormoscilla sp.]
MARQDGPGEKGEGWGAIVRVLAGTTGGRVLAPRGWALAIWGRSPS